jgi:hypothetical protein
LPMLYLVIPSPGQSTTILIVTAGVTSVTRQCTVTPLLLTRVLCGRTRPRPRSTLTAAILLFVCITFVKFYSDVTSFRQEVYPAPADKDGHIFRRLAASVYRALPGHRDHTPPVRALHSEADRWLTSPDCDAILAGDTDEVR